MSEKPAISFIGLGAMGFGMATHLISQGYPVTGFDVYQPTLDRFRAAGGSVATTPSGTITSSTSEQPKICIIMVATAAQAEGAIFSSSDPSTTTTTTTTTTPKNLATSLPQNALLLLCSTVPCGYVQSLQRKLVSQGRGDIHLIDCPVSGGAARAANGTLSIMAGFSSSRAQELSEPILSVLSDASNGKLYTVCCSPPSPPPPSAEGEGGGATSSSSSSGSTTIGAGSNLKMAHQVLAATHILALGEGMGFASRLFGFDPSTSAGNKGREKVAEYILRGGGRGGKEEENNGDSGAAAAAAAKSFMFENRLPRLLTAPEYKPCASAVTIILKDAGIITSEARRSGGLPVPMTATAEQVYFAALGRGWGGDDDSCLMRLYTDGMTTGGSAAAAAAAAAAAEENGAEEEGELDEKKLEMVRDLYIGIYLCSAAECLAVTRKCGLNFDQVFDLCVNAAGSSDVFKDVGPEMIKALIDKRELHASVKAVYDGGLAGAADRLQAVLDEAQRLRMPLYLGTQALTLMRLALSHGPQGEGVVVPEAALVRVWPA